MNSELARAEALIDLGRLDEAIEQLARLMAADPADPAPHCMLSDGLLRAGRAPEALRAAETALGIDPESVPAHCARCDALLVLRQGWTAREGARAAVRLAPQSVEALWCLARAEAAMGAHRRAAVAAGQLAELVPGSSSAYLALGLVAMARDDLTDAKVQLRKALRIDPNNSYALTNLALAESRHQPIAGFRTLGHALRTDPRSEVVRETIRHRARGFLRLILGIDACAYGALAVVGALWLDSVLPVPRGWGWLTVLVGAAGVLLLLHGIRRFLLATALAGPAGVLAGGRLRDRDLRLGRGSLVVLRVLAYGPPLVPLALLVGLGLLPLLPLLPFGLARRLGGRGKLPIRPAAGLASVAGSLLLAAAIFVLSGHVKELLPVELVCLTLAVAWAVGFAMQARNESIRRVTDPGGRLPPARSLRRSSGATSSEARRR